MMTNESLLTVAVAAIAIVVSIGAVVLLNGKKKLPIALDPDQKIAFKLIEREELSHDTRRFRFALQSEKHVLGLPVGQHISLSYSDKDGKLVSRSYTPVTSDDELGYVDFVIKVYHAGVHPKFPEGGKMSQHLDNLKIGETIDMRGPKGRLTYIGSGNIEIKGRPNEKPAKRFAKEIGMIAGGTGITPMLQIVRKALRDPKDKTKFSILFANQTEADILLREELEQMKGTGRVNVWYTLDRPSDDWKYSKGFVDAEMIKAHLPAASPHTQIFMCGPPPMIKFACLPALEQLGHSEDNLFNF